MELRFDADEWAGLDPEDRIWRCRLMVEQTRSLARSASSQKLKTAYSNVAAEWEALANEIERHCAARYPRRVGGLR